MATIPSFQPAGAEATARAMYAVASAGGTQPLSVMDRKGIHSAWSTMVGLDQVAPLDALTLIEPAELAAAVTDPVQRIGAVRMLAVMAFVDAIVEDDKLAYVLEAAGALQVSEDFVAGLQRMMTNDVRRAGLDMLRANVESIPGLAWAPDDPMGAFLPYRDGNDDPTLAERYLALESCASGTLGDAFYHHYHDNHFAFPGQEWGAVEAWATPHDCLHLLSGYSTAAQGELLVAVFNGASLSKPVDMMQSHVLPVVLTYHMGIELNKGINKGDRERLDEDPSWRDNLEGNVHLGLDPAKLWAAWQRGGAMSEDLFSGQWSFWDHVDQPLDELRETYAIPPLRPDDADVPDDEIVRDDFARPGLPLPALSVARVPERPTT